MKTALETAKYQCFRSLRPEVQQALSERAALERFLSPEDAAAVLAVCATQVDPLDPAARSVVPQRLVCCREEYAAFQGAIAKQSAGEGCG